MFTKKFAFVLVLSLLISSIAVSASAVCPTEGALKDATQNSCNTTVCENKDLQSAACPSGANVDSVLAGLKNCSSSACNTAVSKSTACPTSNQMKQYIQKYLPNQTTGNQTTPVKTQPKETNQQGNVTTTKTQNADNLSFEQRVVTLVNEQRAANGLKPLTLNADLSNVARVKSQDMHDNHYFSHTSPTYGSPFDMMKSFGISYRTAGENIAMGYATPEAVMEGWMNSSGHRANILNASFTQIGVGYVADGNYWTQEFIG